MVWALLPLLLVATHLHAASLTFSPIVSNHTNASSNLLAEQLTCPCHVQFGLRLPANSRLRGDELEVSIRYADCNRRSHRTRQVSGRHRELYLDVGASMIFSNTIKQLRFRHFYGPSIQIYEKGYFVALARLRDHVKLGNGSSISMRTSVRSKTCPVMIGNQLSGGRVEIGSNNPHKLVRREKLSVVEIQDARSSSAINPRIVGGDEAPVAASLFVVSLTPKTGGTGGCTGSLMSKRWVLTAAHCNIDKTWIVRVGVSNRELGESKPIEEVFVHELHSSVDFSYDVTLIKLASDAPPNSSFVVINAGREIPKVGQWVRALGYGTVAYGVYGNIKLRQVDIPVILLSKCRQSYKGTDGDPNFDEERVICAGYIEEGGCDSCQGDNGGPLILFDKSGNTIQVGIISWGYECARPNYPGIYVRVSAFTKWMRSKGAVFIDTLKTGDVTVTPTSLQFLPSISTPSKTDIPRGTPSLPLKTMSLTSSALFSARPDESEQVGSGSSAVNSAPPQSSVVPVVMPSQSPRPTTEPSIFPTTTTEVSTLETPKPPYSASVFLPSDSSKPQVSTLGDGTEFSTVDSSEAPAKTAEVGTDVSNSGDEYGTLTASKRGGASLAVILTSVICSIAALTAASIAIAIWLVNRPLQKE